MRHQNLRWTARVAALAFLTLGGCNKSEPKPQSEPDDTDEEDTDIEDTGPCLNQATGIFPKDGATDVSYRTDIVVTLLEREDDLSFSLTSPTGPVPGELTWTREADPDNNIHAEFTFVPDSGLAPNTIYDAEMNYSCGSVSASFTTGVSGTPVGDTCVGTAYAANLEDGSVVAPPLTPTLESLLFGQGIPLLLIEPVSVGSDTITLRAAAGLDGSPPGQDVCYETADIDADFSRDPFIDYGPADTIAAGLPFQDLELEGDIAADCTTIENVALSGVIDLRLFLGDNFGFACGLVPCLPCPDTENACVFVDIQEVTAEEVSGLSLEERTAQDVANDSACQ